MYFQYFQDCRHAQRLQEVLRKLAQHPNERVPQATQSASESRGDGEPLGILHQDTWSR